MNVQYSQPSELLQYLETMHQNIDSLDSSSLQQLLPVLQFSWKTHHWSICLEMMQSNLSFFMEHSSHFVQLILKEIIQSLFADSNFIFLHFVHDCLEFCILNYQYSSTLFLICKLFCFYFSTNFETEEEEEYMFLFLKCTSQICFLSILYNIPHHSKLVSEKICLKLFITQLSSHSNSQQSTNNNIVFYCLQFLACTLLWKNQFENLKQTIFSTTNINKTIQWIQQLISSQTTNSIQIIVAFQIICIYSTTNTIPLSLQQTLFHSLLQFSHFYYSISMVLGKLNSNDLDQIVQQFIVASSNPSNPLLLHLILQSIEWISFSDIKTILVPYCKSSCCSTLFFVGNSIWRWICSHKHYNKLSVIQFVMDYLQLNKEDQILIQIICLLLKLELDLIDWNEIKEVKESKLFLQVVIVVVFQNIFPVNEMEEEIEYFCWKQVIQTNCFYILHHLIKREALTVAECFHYAQSSTQIKQEELEEKKETQEPLQQQQQELQQEEESQPQQQLLEMKSKKLEQTFRKLITLTCLYQKLEYDFTEQNKYCSQLEKTVQQQQQIQTQQNHSLQSLQLEMEKLKLENENLKQELQQRNQQWEQLSNFFATKK